MLDTPRYSTVRLIPFILLSCMLHSGFLLMLPDLTRLFNIHIRHLLPISQVEMEVALIEPTPKTETKPVSSTKARKKTPALLVDDYISSLIDAQLKVSPMLGDSVLPSPVLIDLPTRKDLGKKIISSSALETKLKVAPQELLGKLKSHKLGSLKGRQWRGELGEDFPDKDNVVKEWLSASVQKDLLELEGTKNRVVNSDYGLSGPVAVNREVIFRPDLPKVSLIRDVTVSFRFWVRADGSISRVETRRIGDLELVNVAERYLKQWRFSSISSRLPAKEQWGTVKIIFRVPK